MTSPTMLFDPLLDSSSDSTHLNHGIGNKAASLLPLAAAGINVPRWMALTSEFFLDWNRQIEAKYPYRTLLETSPLSSDARVNLERTLSELEFSDSQRTTIAELVSRVGETEHGYAVRSSCQHEDLSSYSFAGIYKSFLGLRREDLESAIAACFAAYFSDAALNYTARTGLKILEPGFSLMIQAQIACDVAGIGFSLHPVNNRYDIVYLNSNLGLGESVAAGSSDVDCFEVDKYSNSVLVSSVGRKSKRSLLSESGGADNQEFAPSEMPSLSAEQIERLVALTTRVEKAFRRPVEIEWGFAEGELFLFQARPITRWVPLPAQMRTQGGEQPVLYMDRALSDGMTMNRPVSTLGLDIIRGIEIPLYERFVGTIDRDFPVKESLLFHAGSRVYANLSIVLGLTTPKKLIETMAPLNGQLAEILGNADLSSYRLRSKPAYLRRWKIRLLPRIAWRARSLLGKIRKGIKNPVAMRASYDRDVTAFVEALDIIDNSDLPYIDYVERVQSEIVDALVNVFLPALVVVNTGANKPLDKLFPDASVEEKELIDNMKKGFADNVSVAMGRSLAELRRALSSTGIKSAEDAVTAMKAGLTGFDNNSAFEQFILDFGHRGPNEMDVATPRFMDDIHATFAQILSLSEPIAKQESSIPAGCRDDAYAALRAKLRGAKARKLENIHAIYESLGDLRDSPKHYILLGLQKIRQRSLVQGQRLVAEGKLDEDKEVFDLSLHALANPEANLRSEAAINRAFFELQIDSVDAFPTIIDSRGYIPANDLIPSCSTGLLNGTPVSPGIARGRVRLLGSKSIGNIGSSDIVVAYVTDPGLTTCFTSAAGVVLEIGGVLQHGAVVARELGIPCITSVLGATRLLQEGDEIEIDGSAGSVKIL